MLQRHFYLIDHQFLSPERFEGWVLTKRHHRYKIVISFTFSCSCRRFPENYVCKHFLFVLKRIFNVNLYSFDLRLAIMQYHQFMSDDLERIFHGQIRRLSPVVSPIQEKTPSSLAVRRQSIDRNDVCPICFERLLLNDKKLITCFYSCGKSMHQSCMNKWKKSNQKDTHCPICQSKWFQLTIAQRAILEFYTDRSHPIDKRQKYILCCLFTPSACCSSD